MKILVVEDDRTVGQYVKRGLEEQRYQADLVDDGMEGLRLASGGRYDLIVFSCVAVSMRTTGMVRWPSTAHTGRLPVLASTGLIADKPSRQIFARPSTLG